MSNPRGRREGVDRIDELKLMQMRKNTSQQKCADYFGVTKEAVRVAENRVKKKMNSGAVVIAKDNIDAMAQLKYINETITDQLKRCEKLVLREDRKIDEFDAAVAALEQNPDDKEAKKKVDEFAGGPTRTIQVMNAIVHVSSEVRKQIQLQLEVAETIYNLQMMAEFQNEVVQIIKEVDPMSAQKLIARIKERRAIRGLMKPI